MIPRHGDSADHRRLAKVPPVGDTVGMTDSPSPLPNDLDALRALLLAERAAYAAAVIERNAAVAERNTAMAQRDQLAARAAKLEHILTELRRAHFGRKSERITDDQLALALEDLETALAKAEAEDERTGESLKGERAGLRRASRNDQLDHLPHEDVVIEPEAKSCPGCGGALHVIGADVSKRLDKIPAKVRVIVTRRPKYACRTCTDGVVQAPAPARLIASGLPTDALVADVVVSKYADHQPLYRQAQILARQGVSLERSTLASWVGAAAAELEPLYHHLVRRLKASPKLFADETRCPVLDPGRGKTKTGYLWAMARDDRPWGGADPPAVAYAYAPGRGGEHAVELLAELYRVEAEIRGRPPETRRAERQTRSRPIVEGLKPWLEARLAGVSKGSPIGEAIRYGLKHWDGLVLFLDDGRIEIDSNIVERSIRPIALNRKNALFAGHDQGATNWAMLASLIETCKLNDVNPLAWMTDTLTKLVNLWPANRIDELMPWAYAKAASMPVEVG
jgi:transposase